MVCLDHRFVKVPTLVGVYKSMAKLSPVPVLEASVNTVVGRLLSESPQKAVEFIELVGDLVSALWGEERASGRREIVGGSWRGKLKCIYACVHGQG